MNTILIVEDEVNVRKPLEEFLIKEGFKVLAAGSRAEADVLIHQNPDLVLLDWMLPDGQGIELLKKWRHKNMNVPVIMLTARSETIDKVLGLELGAHDYMTKPFEPRELVARIRVQLRDKLTPVTEETLSICGFKIVQSKREAYFENLLLDLTKTEFDLLKIFLENPNKVFNREELLKSVWGYEQYPSTRTVDNHVMQLRQKSSPELFETVHGIGYRFRAKK